jgi:hypothetical protein
MSRRIGRKEVEPQDNPRTGVHALDSGYFIQPEHPSTILTAASVRTMLDACPDNAPIFIDGKPAHFIGYALGRVWLDTGGDLPPGPTEVMENCMACGDLCGGSCWRCSPE